MSEEKYYIIEVSEDGYISVTENSPEDIAKLINVEDESWEQEIVETECNSYMPNVSDPKDWSKRILIIKGKIVAPKGVTMVTKYEIA